MNSVSRTSLDWHHFKSAGHPWSLACLLMICSLLDVTHKEHKWQNSFFCFLEKYPHSALRCWIYRQCAAEFSGGKQQGLTIHYELEWSALFLFLFTSLTGDVASATKLCRLRNFPPSPQAFVTSSSPYNWCIWHQYLPWRVRWFLTLASLRYEFQTSILFKKFLKNH